LLKDLISSEEYESLADMTQAQYLYCPMCKLYYLRTHRDEHKFHNAPAQLSAWTWEHNPESMKRLYRKCDKCGKYVRNNLDKCWCERGC
jgi:hypothetical protein